MGSVPLTVWRMISAALLASAPSLAVFPASAQSINLPLLPGIELDLPQPLSNAVAPILTNLQLPGNIVDTIVPFVPRFRFHRNVAPCCKPSACKHQRPSKSLQMHPPRRRCKPTYRWLTLLCLEASYPLLNRLRCFKHSARL